MCVQPRFEQKPESKKIIALIEQLSAKKNKLQKSSNALGPHSLGHAKHAILSELLTNMHHSIKNFNNRSESPDSIHEMRNFINLLRELMEHMQSINNGEYKAILMQFRNKDREHARKALSNGKWVFTGVAFTLFGLGAAAGACVVGNSLDSFFDMQTDIKNPLPKTYMLFNQLLQVLDLTIKQLIFEMNASQLVINKEVELSNEDNMVCPINRDLIQNPYLCLLDGYSYEKEKLQEWLAKYRVSPVTQKAMKENETIDEVMVLNRNLKEVNDNYRSYLKNILEDQEPLKITK